MHSADAVELDLDRRWRLAPQVALRAERFGALAYHFGTRRLSFLKSPELHEIVKRLDGCSSVRQACRAAGVAEREIPRYRDALATLAQTGMILPEQGS